MNMHIHVSWYGIIINSIYIATTLVQTSHPNGLKKPVLDKTSKIEYKLTEQQNEGLLI